METESALAYTDLHIDNYFHYKVFYEYLKGILIYTIKYFLYLSKVF
jgi:hypothetical protein